MNRQKTLYQPKISILIPLHNSAKYFNSTIKTILNQSYENLEILFHDDASNDETRKILEDLTIKDSRVKYIFSDTNIGSGYSRNKLIEASTGDFIFFIDDDDEFLSPKIIERCVKYLKPNLEILSTQFKYKFDDLGIKIPINNIVKTLKINPSPMHYFIWIPQLLLEDISSTKNFYMILMLILAKLKNMKILQKWETFFPNVRILKELWFIL